MRPPLHPTLFRYLSSVQQSTTIGLHGYFRRNPESPCNARSVYRWQRSLGDQLLVVPNVRVEGLGLEHAHVFVTKPAPEWLSFPYAVEAAWVTPDFCQEVLYVHCIIPRDLNISACFPACERVEYVRSRSGWQQFLNPETAIAIPVRQEFQPCDLLTAHPYIVPAVCELWLYPNSLPLVWARIAQRLGRSLKDWFPRTKIKYVNGKTHITEAFRLLQGQELVRQHIVRYHPLLAASVEVFFLARMEREDVVSLIEGLRAALHAVETYPTAEGYWCRFLGPHRLLDAILLLPLALREFLSLVFFHTKRHPSPIVRFRYEEVFDTGTRDWRIV